MTIAVHWTKRLNRSGFRTPRILLVIVFLIHLADGFAQSNKDSLIVFVGEKISVELMEVDTNHIVMDAGFKAKYRIIQRIYGTYSPDTIEFEAYDHYGRAEFSRFKYVLLYVTRYKGKLCHEKYQFADVYKTKNGRWASGYRVNDYNHISTYYGGATVKPERIEFLEEISYDFHGLTKEEAEKYYISPYYRIEGSRAILVWGNYVEELFELKKQGILRARGYF